MSHSPSPPRTPRLPARALTYQPYSPLRAAAQNFEMNPERQVPLPFRPVAREVGSTPRAYAPVENGLISPLMTSFDEDGERTDSTELSKRFAAHESLYDEPSDSNEEWGSDDEEGRFDLKARRIKERRIRANHRRKDYHDGPPLERRLSHPDPYSRANSPTANRVEPREGTHAERPRRGSVHELQKKRTNLVKSVDTAVRSNLPLYHSEAGAAVLGRNQIVQNFRRKQGRAADHDQEVAHTEQQIALARAAFERDQERIRAHQLGMEERDKGKRRAPYEGEAARKRRDSDASR